MSNRDIILSPVGFVRLDTEGHAIEIEEPYRAALNGLQGFSHINVIWWSHYLAAPEHRTRMECPQPYKNAPSSLGIFATRSPQRPNPVCLSVASVVHVDVEKGLIYLGYIDAEDETPVLDIKPYHPSVDRVHQLSLPAWCSHWPQWYEDSATFDWQSEMNC